MQLIFDTAVIANLATAAFSAVLSLYLLALWFRQKNHLYTDLPLMFGITFMAQAFNTLIRTLPLIGVVEMSLNLFRLRTLVIMGTAFPLLVVALHIWLPRARRHHSRIVGLLAVYWVLVALLGPSEGVIMLLCIPVVLVLSMTMIVTFIITWKTNRLKEVRSDLMVLSFVLGFVSQLVASQVILNNVLITLGTVFSTLGLTNPWFRRRHIPLAMPPESVESTVV
jgi:uncharacterized membrane protein